MDTKQLLQTARSLAEEAAAEVMRLKDQPLNSERKADQSLVTTADLNADKILREGLLEAFPDHGILSEESGILGNPKSEYVWLVDPLDGTKAYAKGIPGFSVMVGLLHQGWPYVGVVVDPITGRTYEASRGGGAYLTEGGSRQSLWVSKRSDYADMPVVVSTGFPQASLKELQIELTGPLLAPINSVGIKVGHVVRQEADVYINHHPVHLWDTCAPQIILEEAGGLFTRIDGTPLEYQLEAPYSHQALTLATNGTRHGDLVSLIEEEKIFC